MKTTTNKKPNSKFNLEKIKVASLKNIHLINGGEALGDDPINTTKHIGQGSSARCLETN